MRHVNTRHLSLRCLAGLCLAGLWFATSAISTLARSVPATVTVAPEPRPFLLGGIQTHELDHERWMAALHQAGMNTVQVTVYAHQGPWNTAKLWYAKEEPAVLAEIRAAHRNGLQVVLVPRVALDHNNSENRHLWHGLIYPETEAATREWFRTYTEFVSKWGRIAEREGVEVLGIASEMNSLTATLPADELPGLAEWYLDDASQERLRALVERSEHLFTEDVRVSMGAGDFESLGDFLIERNRAERVWAESYTFAGHDDRLASLNQRRRILDGLWRDLVKKLRLVYSGRLTLAANFDNYHEVGFWDTLDMMGINAYFPLRQTLETPLGEDALADSWRGIFGQIEKFKERHDLAIDVLFTELGYTRWRGVTVAPWSSQGFIPIWDPEGEKANDRAFFWKAQPIEPAERALALQALHRVWQEDPIDLVGVLYWKLSSVLELRRFEPFMLHLGKNAGDPSLAALQGFAAGIRPLSPFALDDAPYLKAVDATIRDDLEALSALGPNVLTAPGRPPLLHLAVRLGRGAIVRHLLTGGAGLETRDAGGFLPIHWACYQDDPLLVDLLLPLAGTSWRDAAGETPLMKCARLDNPGVMRRLLARRGEQVGARNEAGRTALHLAADQATVEVIEVLAANGADVEAADDEGKTSLHLAARRGAIEVVRVLAQETRGTTDLEGNRPASEAAIHGRAEIFLLLFEPRKAREINVYGQSLLHLAAHGGEPRILETLLRYFPDAEPVDDDGWTPLAFATRNARSEAVEILLRRGASIEHRNQDGTSALHLAAASHEPGLIQQFLRPGIDLDLADSEGNTALHHAAGWGRLENLRLLLAAGADASRRNQAGETPLDVANESGRHRTALLLRPAAD